MVLFFDRPVGARSTRPNSTDLQSGDICSFGRDTLIGCDLMIGRMQCAPTGESNDMLSRISEGGRVRAIPCDRPNDPL